MRTRWVGFDMDECVSSVMPLFELAEYAYRIDNQRDRYMFYYHLAQIIYRSEDSGETWLIRPVMFSVLPILAEAQSKGDIQGAFMYSNNGSAALVTFIGFFFNVCIKLMKGLSYVPSLFQMAAWNGAPCRVPHGMVKSYESIQDCLEAMKLPQCSSRNDLLFFDDMTHQLKYETSFYATVPAYLNHTPVARVMNAVFPLRTWMGESDWSIVTERMLNNQRNDFNRPDNTYVLRRQPSEAKQTDMLVFHSALKSFLTI